MGATRQIWIESCQPIPNFRASSAAKTQSSIGRRRERTVFHLSIRIGSLRMTNSVIPVTVANGIAAGIDVAILAARPRLPRKKIQPN